MLRKIRKIASLAIGIPAGLVAFSEVEDLRYWWVPFVAMGIVVAVLAWNGVFKKKEGYGE
jgi:hypothetical protein